MTRGQPALEGRPGACEWVSYIGKGGQMRSGIIVASDGDTESPGITD